MRAAFRVDSSSDIGTGHFIRCLALANALHERRVQVRFLSRRLTDGCRELLRAEGHEFMTLGTVPVGGDPRPGGLAHADWLGASQQVDAHDCLHALSDQAWDWLIVDHYAIDARWEAALRPATKRILVIDDLGDRRHECELLLDPNLHSDAAKRYEGMVPEGCGLMLGPRYALLRDEFRKQRGQAVPRSGPVRRVMVFFGGVDAQNYTGRALEALAGMPELQVDAVIGAKHPHGADIEAACARLGFNCHVQTTHMAELMAAADLAIGAGGSALWERCCLGLPTISFSTARNQAEQVAAASSEGLVYAPDIGDDMAQSIRRHIVALLENPGLRRSMSRAAMAAVDGGGTARVVSRMGCSGLVMRQAADADARQVFEWRNHPSTRAASRNQEPIAWEDHERWFASTVRNPNTVLLIGQRGETPLGVVRFDIEDDQAQVSIYTVPGMEGRGLGADLLRAAERWLVDNRPAVSTVHAEVGGGNERSLRLFAAADYRLASARYTKSLTRPEAHLEDR